MLPDRFLSQVRAEAALRHRVEQAILVAEETVDRGCLDARRRRDRAGRQGVAPPVESRSLAAAVILAQEGMFEGPTPALVASKAVDFGEIAAIASDVTGHDVVCVTVPDADYEAGMVARGLPAPMAGMLPRIFSAMRGGDLAAEDPTLERLLGTPTTPIRDVLAAHSNH